MSPQDRLLHVLQQIIWYGDGMNVGVGMVLDLGTCRFGQLISLLLASPPGKLSSTGLVGSHLSVMSRGWGQFSCFSALGVSSPTPGPSGTALLCCPGEGPLSQTLQLLRGQEQLYSKTSGAALPALSGSKRLGAHLSLTHATTRQRRGSVRIPTLKFSGLLHLYPLSIGSALL